MADDDSNGGFARKLMLDRFGRLDAELRDLRHSLDNFREVITSDLSEMRQEVATLKTEARGISRVHAGIWGATAGAIPVLLAQFIAWWKGLTTGHQ